jgi:large subunit ribosomal protein L24
MRIRKGDVVKVIAGNKNIKGMIGKVTFVDRQRERVELENGPVHKRHLKPEKNRKHPEGGIIDRQASIHISNVMLMSEVSGRPVRIGFIEAEGIKSRVAKGRGSSGEKI